jgi:hypothetical protein
VMAKSFLRVYKSGSRSLLDTKKKNPNNQFSYAPIQAKTDVNKTDVNKSENQDLSGYKQPQSRDIIDNVMRSPNQISKISSGINNSKIQRVNILEERRKLQRNRLIQKVMKDFQYATKNVSQGGIDFYNGLKNLYPITLLLFHKFTKQEFNSNELEALNIMSQWKDKQEMLLGEVDSFFAQYGPDRSKEINVDINKWKIFRNAFHRTVTVGEKEGKTVLIESKETRNLWKQLGDGMVEAMKTVVPNVSDPFARFISIKRAQIEEMIDSDSQLREKIELELSTQKEIMSSVGNSSNGKRRRGGFVKGHNVNLQ